MQALNKARRGWEMFGAHPLGHTCIGWGPRFKGPLSLLTLGCKGHTANTNHGYHTPSP